MTTTGKKKNDEDDDDPHHVTVEQIIKSLGLRVISDEELDEGLDKLLSEYPKDTPFGKLMGEARRRFVYKKDLDIVAAALKKKMMSKKWAGCGISSLFF